MAGERGGEKIEDFDMGNSPFEYQSEDVKGRKVAISTTNGTNTILKSLEADEILVGAFLNIQATAEYLLEQGKPVVIHCAGWRGAVNVEDTLYAGALIDELAEEMEIEGDSALIAHQLFVGNHENTEGLARQSGHAKRLTGFGAEEDLSFCMTENEYSVVCRLQDGHLIS